MNIPELLVKHLDAAALNEFHVRLKRTRRRFIPFCLNARTAYLLRRTAVELVAGELKTRAKP